MVEIAKCKREDCNVRAKHWHVGDEAPVHGLVVDFDVLNEQPYPEEMQEYIDAEMARRQMRANWETVFDFLDKEIPVTLRNETVETLLGVGIDRLFPQYRERLPRMTGRFSYGDSDEEKGQEEDQETPNRND
jgi:hypothetical protein